MPKSLEGRLTETVILGPHFPFINEQATKQKNKYIIIIFPLKVGFDGCNSLSSESSEKKVTVSSRPLSQKDQYRVSDRTVLEVYKIKKKKKAGKMKIPGHPLYCEDY